MSPQKQVIRELIVKSLHKAFNDNKTILVKKKNNVRENQIVELLLKKGIRVLSIKDTHNHIFINCRSEAQRDKIMEMLKDNLELDSQAVQSSEVSNSQIASVHELLSAKNQWCHYGKTHPIFKEETFVGKLKPVGEELPRLEEASSDEKTFSLTEEDLESPFTSGNCIKCSRISVTTCSRCSSFYCSKECQTQDWADHRAECTKESSIAEIEEESKPVIVDLINKTAFLTSFKSATEISIQLTDNYDSFIELINDVSEEAVVSRYLETPPSIGDNVLVRNSENLWHRGKIEATFEDQITVSVRLIDEGSLKIDNWKNLKDFRNESLINIKPSLLNCVLTGINSPDLSYKAEELLKSLIEDNSELIIKSNDLNNMTVLFGETYESLNNLIDRYLKIEIDPISEPPLKFDDMPFFQIQKLENQKMVVTDFSNLDKGIALTPLDQFLQINRYNNQFQNYIPHSDNGYVPRDHELCLVQLGDTDIAQKRRWFRAVGLASVGDKFPKVLLIDYFLKIQVHHTYIRKFSKDLLYPSACHFLTLTEECGHNTTKGALMLNVLNEPFYQVDIPQLKELEGGSYAVHCPDMLSTFY